MPNNVGLSQKLPFTPPKEWPPPQLRYRKAVSQIESSVNSKPKSALNYIYALFWSSAPRSFFRLLSRFQKVNKLQFGGEKRSTLWPKNEFFNMDALTVLSIWDSTVEKLL